MIAAEKFLLQPIASICETARQFYKNGNLPDLHEALGENLFKIGSVPAAMAHANALFGFDNDNDNNNDSPNFQLSCLNLFAPTHRHPPKMFYLIRQCLLFLSPPTLESIAVSSLKRIQLHQMLKFWLSPSSTINDWSKNLFKIGSVPAAMAHANALFGFDNDNDNNNDSPNFQLSCLNLFAPTHRHPPKMFYLIRQCLLFLSPPTLESIAVSSLKRIQLHQMLKFWLSPSSTINISTENPVLDIGTRHVFLTVYQGATEVVADRVIYEQLVELHKRLSPTLLNYSNVQSPPPPLAPVPAKRRIGLISAHLKWHSVGRLLHGVFTNLATSSQFDLFFIFVGDHDQSNSNIDFTKTLDAAHHIHLNPNDFKSNQQTLTQLNLDVLIFSDLNLDSATTFLAYGRYARVQIGFWGHPVSSMLDSMDYFVGSELWAKKGEDHSFGEQVSNVQSPPPPLAPVPAKRRIGLISAHLKWHSVGRLLHGVFTNLATSSQFDLFFIFVGDHDQSNSNIDFTKTLDAAHHIHLNPNDFKSNQQTLTQLNLDVLIFSDLNLDSATTFLAYGRYARVQIGFWGHPVSSMLDSMDYFVGSELWAKKGEDHSFGEQVILFDSMTTHFAEPPIATTPYIPRYPNNTLYLCAQTIMKLNPLFDPVFNEILQSDHNSVIVLIGNSHQLLWAERVKMRILDSVDAGKGEAADGYIHYY